MKIKMKRGDFLLGEETLKIIIAVIAISFLVYLLASLYFSFNSSRDLDQAKSSLNFLITSAKSGASSASIYNPKNWWIMHWTQSQEIAASRKAGYQIPSACSGLQPEDCLCICQDTGFGCSTGVCSYGEGFSVDSPIQISNPPITVNINQTDKKITG